MKSIDEMAINYVNAREKLRMQGEVSRSSALVRHEKDMEIVRLKFKLGACRLTLALAIIVNFYAAAKGWGIL